MPADRKTSENSSAFWKTAAPGMVHSPDHSPSSRAKYSNTSIREIDMRLADKVAIVAGGGMGIGRACARLFAQEGARLVLCDIDPQAGQKTVAEIAAEQGRVIFVQADLSDGQQVQRLIQKTLEAC